VYKLSLCPTHYFGAFKGVFVFKYACSGFDDCVLIYILSLKVAINGWLHQYFESVVSMYEDRFELYVLSRRGGDKAVDSQSEKTNWFRLAFQKPSTSTPVDYVCISPFSLPVRRTKELRALTGWYPPLHEKTVDVFHMQCG
jgi:hypothetical protein